MLEVHFLNVGHGDCTIVKHPSGRLTMLDINNGQLLDKDGIAEEAAASAPAPHGNRLLPAGIGGALGASSYPLPSSQGFVPAGIGGALGAASANPLLGLAGGWTETAGIAGAPPATNRLLPFAFREQSTNALAGIAAYPYCPPPPGARGGITTLLGRPAAYRSDLVDPIAYLDRHFPGEPIHRYIQTHPDLDHMRGLARLLRLRRVFNFWHPQDTKPTPTFRDEEDREDWNTYQGVRAGRLQGVNVLSPSPGAPGAFWQLEQGGQPGGDGIQVLSPTQELVTWCNGRGDSNNISYVVALDYGGRRLLLGGDAEAGAWERMAYRYGGNLSCWLLKASHHGRDSGYHGPALDLLRPVNVIVSVGKKPDTDAHAKYKARGATVLSTRRHGTLVVSVQADGRCGLQCR